MSISSTPSVWFRLLMNRHAGSRGEAPHIPSWLYHPVRVLCFSLHCIYPDCGWDRKIMRSLNESWNIQLSNGSFLFSVAFLLCLQIWKNLKRPKLPRWVVRHLTAGCGVLNPTPEHGAWLCGWRGTPRPQRPETAGSQGNPKTRRTPSYGQNAALRWFLKISSIIDKL